MTIKFLKAGNGDAILISLKESDSVRNIIIDGGVSATYYNPDTNTPGELQIEIDKIRKVGQFIDLLVLTHIDNDHICGITEWFRTDSRAGELVKQVWFNSGKTIANYLKHSENEDLRIGISRMDKKTGVAEAVEFEEYLEKSNIWDKKIIIQGQEVELFGLKFTFLSPTIDELERLLKHYREKLGQNTYTAARESDWKIPLKQFIEEESGKGFRFIQDDSLKNGSSISFLITYDDRSFLFLGDSHPNTITKQLAKFGWNKENPLEVEFVKVSHHGSKGNTSRKLIEALRTNDYVFSTDSSGHFHPHKRTIARILSVNPAAIFHFNYEYVRNSLFSEEDRDTFTICARVISEKTF